MGAEPSVPMAQSTLQTTTRPARASMPDFAERIFSDRNRPAAQGYKTVDSHGGRAVRTHGAIDAADHHATGARVHAGFRGEDLFAGGFAGHCLQDSATASVRLHRGAARKAPRPGCARLHRLTIGAQDTILPHFDPYYFVTPYLKSNCMRISESLNPAGSGGNGLAALMAAMTVLSSAATPVVPTNTTLPRPPLRKITTCTPTFPARPCLTASGVMANQRLLTEASTCAR